LGEFVAQVVGDPLVRVEGEHPLVARHGDRGIALSRDRRPRHLHHLGPALPGDRHRVVGRAAVGDDHFVRPAERVHRLPDLPGFVEGGDHDRDGEFVDHDVLRCARLAKGGAVSPDYTA